MCVRLYFRNPRFARGRQEDSHEALKCIFDALKDEEIQVCYIDGTQYDYIGSQLHSYSLYVVKRMNSKECGNMYKYITIYCKLSSSYIYNCFICIFNSQLNDILKVCI